MKLATVDEALASAGLASRTGSNTQMIDAALETATSQLATSIGTTFDREERIDYFGRNLRNFGSSNSPEFVCNLTNGFIDGAAKVWIATAESVTELGIGMVKTSDANAERLSALRYEVDAEKGRMRLYSTGILCSLRRAVAVRYVSGFVDTAGIAQEVPDGLKQAAIMVALRILRITPPTKPKALHEDARALGMVGIASYANMKRSFLRGAYPEYTEDKTA